MKNKLIRTYCNVNIFLTMAILLCVVMSKNSYATDAIVCEGTVATIGVHGTDRVILRLSSMNTVVNICNLNSTLGTTYPISAEQCKAAYSTLLTAYSLGKTMSIYFDNVQTGTSCSNFAAWEVATARWVALTN